MPELLFTKVGQALAPACDEAADWLRRKKAGATILVDPKEPRNGAFHRKYFALIDMSFDYWSDAVEPMEFKGERVLPDKDRFRKDLTILAGFYRAVANLKGEIRIEAQSISWASMTEETFGKLYDATITVLLAKVFNGRVCPKWTEEQIRSVADQVMEFAA